MSKIVDKKTVKWVFSFLDVTDIGQPCKKLLTILTIAEIKKRYEHYIYFELVNKIPLYN